jgi:hypothetical protein
VRPEDRRAEGNDGDTKRQHHGRRTAALPNITICSVTKDVGCETITSGTVVNPTIPAALVLMVLMTVNRTTGDIAGACVVDYSSFAGSYSTPRQGWRRTQNLTGCRYGGHRRKRQMD